jgi:hypothetical protein
MGTQGYGVMNIQGEEKLRTAQEAGMAIANTYFAQPATQRKIYSCDGQIDCMAIPEESVSHQHRSVLGKLSVKKWKFPNMRECKKKTKKRLDKK